MIAFRWNEMRSRDADTEISASLYMEENILVVAPSTPTIHKGNVPNPQPVAYPGPGPNAAGQPLYSTPGPTFNESACDSATTFGEFGGAAAGMALGGPVVGLAGIALGGVATQANTASCQGAPQYLGQYWSSGPNSDPNGYTITSSYSNGVETVTQIPN